MRSGGRHGRRPPSHWRHAGGHGWHTCQTPVYLGATPGVVACTCWWAGRQAGVRRESWPPTRACLRHSPGLGLASRQGRHVHAPATISSAAPAAPQPCGSCPQGRSCQKPRVLPYHSAPGTAPGTGPRGHDAKQSQGCHAQSARYSAGYQGFADLSPRRRRRLCHRRRRHLPHRNPGLRLCGITHRATTTKDGEVRGDCAKGALSDHTPSHHAASGVSPRQAAARREKTPPPVSSASFVAS